jgi:hypothetical protein
MGAQPSAGYPHAGALAAAYRKYAWTHLRWVPRPRVPIQRMGAPPGIWTFLSSLGESGFFSLRLVIASCDWYPLCGSAGSTGVRPPTPEWGAVLSNARSYLIVPPHMATIPGLAIMFVVVGFNLFGDGLRDTLDPRLSASARNYGDVSPVPRTTPRTPGASSMPARPYPGSVRSGSGPPCRGRARPRARRLGSARGTWTYPANVYVIEFLSACTKAVETHLGVAPLAGASAVRCWSRCLRSLWPHHSS